MKFNMKFLATVGLMLVFAYNLNAQTIPKNEIQMDIRPIFQSGSGSVMFKYVLNNSSKFRLGVDFSFTQDTRTEEDTLDLEFSSMGFATSFGYETGITMNKSRFGFGADAYLSNWAESQDYWEFSNQSIENYKVKYSKYGLQPLLNINYNFTDHFYISAEVKGFIGINEQNQDKGTFSKSYDQRGLEADIIDQMLFFVGLRF